MPVRPSSVSIFSVTKLRPGQQTMTRAAVIFMAGAGPPQGSQAPSGGRSEATWGLSSHHRAQRPRHEFVLAVAVQLALGLAPRRGRQHQLEDALAHLVDARGAVDDRAAVDVDVVL